MNVRPPVTHHDHPETDNRLRDLERALDIATRRIELLDSELRQVRDQIREYQYELDESRLGAEVAEVLHRRAKR